MNGFINLLKADGGAAVLQLLSGSLANFKCQDERKTSSSFSFNTAKRSNKKNKEVTLIEDSSTMTLPFI